jgi:hypothetical protein
LKKKFAESFITSVRCERSLVKLAKLLGISHEEALKKGILLNAEFKLQEYPDLQPTEAHDLFLALKQKDLEEFTDWLTEQKFTESKLREMADQKRKIDESQKTIFVYASDLEETIEIPEDQFDPRYHTKKAVSS